MDIYEKKINWRAVAKIASEKHGRELCPSYCRNVYVGNNNSPKLLKILKSIINGETSSRKENTIKK